MGLVRGCPSSLSRRGYRGDVGIMVGRGLGSVLHRACCGGVSCPKSYLVPLCGACTSNARALGVVWSERLGLSPSSGRQSESMQKKSRLGSSTTRSQTPEATPAGRKGRGGKRTARGCQESLAFALLAVSPDPQLCGGALGRGGVCYGGSQEAHRRRNVLDPHRGGIDNRQKPLAHRMLFAFAQKARQRKLKPRGSHRL
jgi:hypothetical protein